MSFPILWCQTLSLPIFITGFALGIPKRIASQRQSGLELSLNFPLIYVAAAVHRVTGADDCLFDVPMQVSMKRGLPQRKSDDIRGSDHEHSTASQLLADGRRTKLGHHRLLPGVLLLSPALTPT